MNKKFLYFFPFYYDFFVRVKDSYLKKIMGYFLLFSFIPLYLIIFKNENIFLIVLTYLVALTISNFIYELGHIYNDFFSVKKENFPTRKHNNSLTKKEYWKIFLTRMILIIPFLFAFWGNPLTTALALFLFPLYTLHNNLKENFRPVTFLFLRVWKIFWIISFFELNKIEIISILLIYFSFNFIEILAYTFRKVSKKDKAHLRNFKVFTNKRIYYYLTIMISLLINILLLIFGLKAQKIFLTYYITYVVPRLNVLIKK